MLRKLKMEVGSDQKILSALLNHLPKIQCYVNSTDRSLVGGRGGTPFEIDIQHPLSVLPQY